MSSDWWAKKLAPQQPQQRGVAIPPVLPPQHYSPQPPHHGAPGTYQQPPQAPQPQQQPPEDPNRKLSLREAVSRFSGGESARVEGGVSCPQCGSTTSYTEFRGMGGMAAGVMGNRPAPQCMECGYNGRFVQGDQATWA